MLLTLQLYFDKIKELTVGRYNSVLFKEVLVSLATDSGIHPLVPYFTYFIADEVSLKDMLGFLELLKYHFFYSTEHDYFSINFRLQEI